MKKIIYFLCIALLSLSLCSCSGVSLKGKNSVDEATQNVIDLIDDIGEIDNYNCLAKISKANAAFEALNTEQQKNVSNYSELQVAVLTWTSKYYFDGIYYYVDYIQIYDSNLKDISKTKSSYVSLVSEADDCMIQISDEHDKILFIDGDDYYFGTIERHSSSNNVEAGTLNWETVPMIIEGEELSNAEVWLPDKDGNCGLFFIYNGNSAKESPLDALRTGSPDAVAAIYQLRICLP